MLVDDRTPADVEIVAYCRGRYCVFAPDAVRLRTGARARVRRGHRRGAAAAAAGGPVTFASQSIR